MNALTTRMVICGGLLLVTLISGVILSHSGRPFNVGIFAVHKLSALGTVVLIAMSISPLSKALEMSPLSVSTFAVTGLLFLGLIVSGALLSFDRPVAQAILRIHQIVPWLAVAAATSSMVILVSLRA